MWKRIDTVDPDMKEGLFARRDSMGEWCVESFHTCQSDDPDEDLRAVSLALTVGAEYWQQLPAPPGDGYQCPKIITAYIYPPIPTRCFDWSAHYEGEEDEQMDQGWGRSEVEAITDLKDNYPRPKRDYRL